MSEDLQKMDAFEACETLFQSLMGAFDNLIYVLNASGHYSFVSGDKEKSEEAMKCAIEWSLSRAQFQRVQESLSDLPRPNFPVSAPELCIKFASPHELIPLFGYQFNAPIAPSISQDTPESGRPRIAVEREFADATFRATTKDASRLLDFSTIPIPAAQETNLHHSETNVQQEVTKTDDHLEATLAQSDAALVTSAPQLEECTTKEQFAENQLTPPSTEGSTLLQKPAEPTPSEAQDQTEHNL